jgi:hypothetical protein
MRYLQVAVKIPKVQELTPEQLEKFKQEVRILFFFFDHVQSSLSHLMLVGSHK